MRRVVSYIYKWFKELRKNQRCTKKGELIIHCAFNLQEFSFLGIFHFNFRVTIFLGSVIVIARSKILIAIKVNTVTATQGDWSLSIDKLELGFVRNQKVHVLLIILTSFHGHDGRDNLSLLVALALNLDHGHISVLRCGRQDGILDEQPVSRLHSWILSIIILGVSRIFRIPQVLLGCTGESAAPQIFFLDAVRSHGEKLRPLSCRSESSYMSL